MELQFQYQAENKYVFVEDTIKRFANHNELCFCIEMVSFDKETESNVLLSDPVVLSAVEFSDWYRKSIKEGWVLLNEK